MSELTPVIARERSLRLENIIVLKCGGSSIDDLSEDFFTNIKTLKTSGLKPVIVHGGGPAIQKMLEQLEIQFEFIDGLRKTTEEMMDVVEMVLTGHVNPALTRIVNQAGMKAVGVSGSDMNLLKAVPIDYERYGLVGEIIHVNSEYIKELLRLDIVPIISPIAIGSDGKKYNVNADTAAGAVASALQANQLVFVTDVPGILKQNQLIDTVTTEEIEQFIKDGTIYGGMIPKVKAAMKGLSSNVQEVMIVNGKRSTLRDTTTLTGTTITVSRGVKVNI